MKKKVELNKVKRDVMLLEAQQKKMQDMDAVRQRELLEVKQFKQDMEIEKKKK